MASSVESPQFLRLLAHDLRWQLLQALSKSDLRVQELASITTQPQNLVSYHLGRLMHARLLREHRSIADGREVYYSLDVARLKEMYFDSGRALHPALGGFQAAPNESPPSRPLQVLFLCTHNSARSQMAEALMNRRSQGWVLASSAGLMPAKIHPMTIQVLDELGIDAAAQYTKPLVVFQGQVFDALVTVCDRSRPAATTFKFARQQLHWSLPDPLEARGGRSQQLSVFRSVAVDLDSRIGHLLARLRSEHAGNPNLSNPLQE